ncbi:MAG: MBL fold metallo-hydrolase [Salinivirgaceae bacterium]|nr:MBL fold metallo-hydrolase [Salinivirgaceae bacterium]
MNIFVLTDNLAGGNFLAEHGLSYIIAHENKSILFDTGHSDVFIKNAEKLNINIQTDIDTVVLSHGHWDHGNGLQYIKDKTLITHPNSFIKRYRKKGTLNIGLDLSQAEIEDRFNLITTRKSYKISDSLFFLGEIPRLNDFEAKSTLFVTENGDDDYIIDDSAIVSIENNELNIITGCSHSGICNIINHAVQVTGISKINAVIGGFHLKHDNEQTKKTIAYLKFLGVKKIFPSHCTELPALCAFHKEFNFTPVKTGMNIHIT